MKLVSCYSSSIKLFSTCFLQCSDRDVLGGWCDSGSIFVADIRGVNEENGLHLPSDLDVSAETTF